MTEQTNDPWDAAEDAEPRKPIYWGNLVADAHFVVLEKNIGRLPFDPQKHPKERRVTAVDLSLLCITEQNVQNPIERQVIAEFGEWTKFIKPSIVALGIEPHEIHEKFVKVEMVPTGRKYTNDSGEEIKASTFKFLKVFADESECIADYLSGDVEEELAFATQEAEDATRVKINEMAAEGKNLPEIVKFFEGSVTPAEVAQASITPAEVAQAKTDNGDGNGEKETALLFLKVLVDSAVNGQTDLKVVQETLAGGLKTTPLVAKYFTVDSPETIELIMQGMGKDTS